MSQYWIINGWHKQILKICTNFQFSEGNECIHITAYFQSITIYSFCHSAVYHIFGLHFSWYKFRKFLIHIQIATHNYPTTETPPFTIYNNRSGGSFISNLISWKTQESLLDLKSVLKETTQTIILASQLQILKF